MSAKTIMLQGTSSNAGKSILCTALCRIFRQNGWKVAPFKSQNMALNSYITRDGGEIGRAQGAQAEAAGVEATVDMNPILLKPKKDMVAQVILHGRPYADMSAKEYREDYIPKALNLVNESLERLKSVYDIVVIEGAGSPAEINLKDRDIANMKIAELADAPVILVADIDRGGVFASIIGTLELLTPSEQDRVAGFIINKFRGDIDLLYPGLEFLKKRTGKPVLGVVPYIFDLRIADEDSVALNEKTTDKNGEVEIDIAVIKLPRISNFTDFDSLLLEPGVSVRYIKENERLGQPDAVIIPGTKNTVEDLTYLRETGQADEILALAGKGTPVVGICGGYQMLGKKLLDPYKAESDKQEVKGLGLLPIVTTFDPEKITTRVRAEVISNQGFFAGIKGLEVNGYEIHMGRSRILSKGAEPLFAITDRNGEPTVDVDGTAVDGGIIFGSYLHGLFDNDRFRRKWINFLREKKGLAPLKNDMIITAKMSKEQAYDSLAATVRNSINMDMLYRILNVG